jgi:MFS family permease
MTRLRGPLASSSFRVLIGCDLTTTIGTAMAGVAVPFAVLRIGGSASDIGLVAAAGFVPTIVFLLFGGVVADRVPRQHVMVAADLGAGAAQAVFAVLVLVGHAQVWELMVLTAGRGAAVGFYLPAAQGLVPQTVAADQLAAANSVRRLGLNSAHIAGAAVGGIVVGLLGPGWGLAADAASYLVAAVMRLGMRLGPLPPAVRAGILPELRDGWRTFVSHTWLWSIVVQCGVLNAVFAGGFSVLGPVVAVRHLGGARGWGLVIAVYSLGAMLGAALSLRYRPVRLLRAGTVAFSFGALPLFALAVEPQLGVVAVAAGLAGVGMEFFEVAWSTAIQEQIAPSLLSRVAAYDALGSYALGPVGTTVAGPIALAVGATATLAGGGIVILVATAAVFAIGDVRHLTRRSASPVGSPARETSPENAAI